MNLNILLVAATPLESNWLNTQLGSSLKGHNTQLLVTGIGMVNTAYALGRVFATERVDLALNFGICGSYSGHSQLEVVEVISDCFAEMGATEADGSFSDMEQMGFPLFDNHFNQLANPNPSSIDVPKVKGVTVNTVSGHTAMIERRRSKWQPDIGTMENAAFFQCCLQAGVLFHSFRCVSNPVTPRDKSQWQIPEAAQKMQEFILQQLTLLTP